MQERLNRGAVSAKARAIEPGETVESLISLSEDFEMNRKGVYKVTVQRWVGVAGIFVRELSSNTITISVVGDPSVSWFYASQNVTPAHRGSHTYQLL
jgi:hypothetical protein